MKLTEIPDPALVVLIGAAGSGKSTLAQATWPGQVLSSDELRGVIAGDSRDQEATGDAFAVLHLLAQFRLARKLTTVADATSATTYARRALLGIASVAHVPAVAVVVHPPLAAVLARNAGREHPVPEDVVRRQHRQVTDALSALYAEGFWHVIMHDVSGQLPRPGDVCSPDHCRNGVACYAPACYGRADYGRADQEGGTS